MPWYPDVSARLTDEQLWTIVCADPEIKLPQLAAAVGALPRTVNTARWRLRTFGWTCPVNYAVCRYCGHPLTRRGNGQERRAYHPACRPLVRTMLRREPERRRWHALPAEVRCEHLAGLKAFDAAHQAATKAMSIQHQARWTIAEDAVLIARQDEPAHVLAYELRRSLYSVRHRRNRLRARGLLE